MYFKETSWEHAYNNTIVVSQTQSSMKVTFQTWLMLHQTFPATSYARQHSPWGVLSNNALNANTLQSRTVISIRLSCCACHSRSAESSRRGVAPCPSLCPPLESWSGSWTRFVLIFSPLIVWRSLSALTSLVRPRPEARCVPLWPVEARMTAEEYRIAATNKSHGFSCCGPIHFHAWACPSVPCIVSMGWTFSNVVVKVFRIDVLLEQVQTISSMLNNKWRGNKGQKTCALLR